MKICYNKKNYDLEEHPPDETVKKILEDLDKKRSDSEILNSPADDCAEADKILQSVRLLKKAGNAIIPPKSLLAKTFSEISRTPASLCGNPENKNPTVTNYPSNRYTFGEKKEKGRLFASKISNLINLLNMNKQVIAGIGILVLVLGIGIAVKKARRAPLPPVPTGVVADEELRQLQELMKDTDIEDLDSDSIESELAQLPKISSDSPSPSSSSKPAAQQPAESEAQLSKELADLQQLMGDTNFDMDEGLSGLDTAL